MLDSTDGFDPTQSQPLSIGGWETQISDQPVVLAKWQRGRLETVLNQQYLPAVRELFLGKRPQGNRWFAEQNAPAPIVRFDMAPMIDVPDESGKEDQVTAARAAVGLGIWEIEANTAGLGIATKLGLPVAARLFSTLQQSGISRIGYAASESRSNQAGDLQVLMSNLESYGVETVPVNLDGEIPADLPLWLRAGAEDLVAGGSLLSRLPQCLMWHPDGGGSKQYLFDLDPSVTRASDIVNLASVPTRFDTGVVLKPINGWGARDITIHAREQPFKKRSDKAGRLFSTLQRLRAQGADSQYLLQRFAPPQSIGEGFLAWRVLAVWQPKRQAYQIIGGIWNYRKGDIRLHGTPETINGPILVDK